MGRLRIATCTLSLVALGLGGCGIDADDGDAVDAGTGSGEDVATADIVEAGLVRLGDLDDVAHGDEEAPATMPVDEEEPAELACGTYATIAPDGPAPEVVETSEVLIAHGDDGTAYTVRVRGEVVVLDDEAEATRALAAVEAGPWGDCLREAYDEEDGGGRSVDDEGVALDEDDGRAVVSADVGYPEADDTGHVTSVRVARAGRALVVVSSRAAGQVLEDFGDGEPIDDLIDEVAARVEALG